jgi:23S rRNA (cytidine1920-2'-O)/16S rRNA (cytidine1409-2'-O)-methyltransferase
MIHFTIDFSEIMATFVNKMPKPRARLDVFLVDAGLVDSRSRAQAMIMAGKVLVNDRPATKAGDSVPEGAAVRLREADHPWASRGGLKLDHALHHFGLTAAGQIAADIGASTGGFVDVLLTRGAVRVYAVDVGHGQLAWKLRSDPRVVVLERLNARFLTPEQIPEPLDLVTSDVSFISLTKALPPTLAMVRPGGQCVLLIKPQFEAGPECVEKGGVVRDPAVHQAVCSHISGWLDSLPGWQVRGLVESPVLGPEGNREFLVWGVQTGNR